MAMNPTTTGASNKPAAWPYGYGKVQRLMKAARSNATHLYRDPSGTAFLCGRAATPMDRLDERDFRHEHKHWCKDCLEAMKGQGSTSKAKSGSPGRGGTDRSKTKKAQERQAAGRLKAGATAAATPNTERQANLDQYLNELTLIKGKFGERLTRRELIHGLKAEGHDQRSIDHYVFCLDKRMKGRPIIDLSEARYLNEIVECGDGQRMSRRALFTYLKEERDWDDREIRHYMRDLDRRIQDKKEQAAEADHIGSHARQSQEETLAGQTGVGTATYRVDLRAQAARSAFYGYEGFEELNDRIVRTVGKGDLFDLEVGFRYGGCTLAEAIKAVDDMPENQFQQLIQNVPEDWWD